MSAIISIMLKGPVDLDSMAVTQEAIEFIPGETIEQLVSRLLYQFFWSTQWPEKKTRWEMHPWSGASFQTIEIRLVRKVD